MFLILGEGGWGWRGGGGVDKGGGAREKTLQRSMPTSTLRKRGALRRVSLRASPTGPCTTSTFRDPDTCTVQHPVKPRNAENTTGIPRQEDNPPNRRTCWLVEEI